MANRRDLHIGIDGDSRGLEDAFNRSEDSARGLDRELEKLERAQKDAEKATDRTAAATRRLTLDEEKAALAARKMGNDVAAAAKRAEAATKRAEAAAKAHERGLISEATALKAKERAEIAVERASVKAAEAAIAERAASERLAEEHEREARAADKAAEQERQLARDAQLAAVAQRLGALKAAGAVREYNAVLAQTKANHGNLSGTAVAGFREITTGAKKATHEAEGMAAQFRELGAHATLVGLVNALVLLPELASVAGGAITLGLGGALVGLAMKSQMANKQVQRDFANTKHDIVSEFSDISKPFAGVMSNMAHEADVEFSTLAPSLEKAFGEMAPATDRFVAEAIASLSQFNPFIESLGHAFATVTDDLGPHLGDITHNMATGLKAITDATAANPGALTGFIVGLSKLVRYTGDGVGVLIRFKNQFELLTLLMGSGGPLGVFKFIDGLANLKDKISDTSHELQTGGGQFKSFGEQAASGGVKLSALEKDLETLADSEASATEKANALSDAFERLLNPAEAVFTDTAKLKDSVGELAKALKKSHGSLTDNTTASRAAKNAFTGMMDGAKALASDMLNSGKSVDQVRAKLNPYIHTMYQAAGSNKQARALVDAFVKSLGAMPAKKGTTLTLDDQDFLARLHAAQGLRLDPKTGLLKGDGSGYFNAWLKSNRLRLDPKTGRFRGDNADYYNKWLAANHLRIDPKTGVIKGNTAAFWNSVHAIPTVVGNRQINVRYVPQNSANEPGTTRHADGGIDRYADGGMRRRDLDPMIVDRPTVLFGETETGGEAYIPLGDNKRARSTMLLADVARMFGLAVVKPMADGGLLAGVRAFADGGGLGDVGLGQIISDWTSSVSPASKSDVTAATKARKTQINQLRNAEDALYRARHARHRSARDIAAAERRVAAEREDVAAATKKLADVEQRYKYGKQSPATQLGSALGATIKNTAAFVKNLTTLTERGFGTLAQQLLAMGGPQAEKIAADAVKMSNAKLGGLQGQIGQVGQQQDTLAHLGGILKIKTAMQGGSTTWDQLISVTGLAPNDLAAALKLMAGDLAKTATGQALLAMMKAHGYVRGGEITGPAGTDRVPLWGTAGEWVVPKGPAAQHRQLLAALTYGRPLAIPAGTVRGGDGASAGRPIEIHVHARDTASALSTAKAVSHELGWKLKQGGSA